jgi:hypothetical protein
LIAKDIQASALVTELVALVPLRLYKPLDCLFEFVQAGLNLVRDLEMMRYPFRPDVHLWIIIRVLFFSGHKCLNREVKAGVRKDVLLEFSRWCIRQRGGNKLEVQAQKRTDISGGLEPRFSWPFQSITTWACLKCR